MNKITYTTENFSHKFYTGKAQQFLRNVYTYNFKIV